MNRVQRRQLGHRRAAFGVRTRRPGQAQPWHRLRRYERTASMLFRRATLTSGFVPAAPGQIFITATGTWTVPAGVTSISMVCVQQSYHPASVPSVGTEVEVASVVVCRAKNGSRIGDGGGDGGDPDAPGDFGDGTYSGGGGGGAAGYSANGNTASGGCGGYGTGGHPNPGDSGSGGGGVGLLGVGSSGSNGGGSGGAGTGGSGGANGSSFAVGGDPPGGNYGGGKGGHYDNSVSNASGFKGGALAYKNSVAVSPGSSVTVRVTSTATTGGQNGAIRIMWGGSRSYPSNAADM